MLQYFPRPLLKDFWEVCTDKDQRFATPVWFVWHIAGKTPNKRGQPLKWLSEWPLCPLSLTRRLSQSFCSLVCSVTQLCGVAACLVVVRRAQSPLNWDLWGEELEHQFHLLKMLFFFFFFPGKFPVELNVKRTQTGDHYFVVSVETT